MSPESHTTQGPHQWSSSFQLRQYALQYGPFPGGQVSLFHKAHQQFFARAAKDAADEVGQQVPRDLFERSQRLEPERPLVVRLPEEALFDEDPHERGDGGIGQVAAGSGQVVADGGDGLFAPVPEDVHDLQLAFGQFTGFRPGHDRASVRDIVSVNLVNQFWFYSSHVDGNCQMKISKNLPALRTGRETNRGRLRISAAVLMRNHETRQIRKNRDRPEPTKRNQTCYSCQFVPFVGKSFFLRRRPTNLHEYARMKSPAKAAGAGWARRFAKRAAGAISGRCGSTGSGACGPCGRGVRRGGGRGGVCRS